MDTGMNIHAARLYVSPRTRPLTVEEKETRRLSYALKDWTAPGFSRDVDTAAREMARLIRGPCHLVPVPSSTGSTAANRALCRAIAFWVTGAKVRDGFLIRTRPVPSSCHRHRASAGGLPV